jgi:CheY-like chemotaxis protein
MSAAPPRVVFVDDDAAIRRLVASVLEDLPIELVCCASVAEARAALRERAARLLITDLMLPVETGFDLLASLAADPGLRAGAHLAVFSAGLNAGTRARLEGLGVWRELAKPVSLQALEDCVSDALALPPDAAAPATPAVPEGVVLHAHEAHAIATQFGGDAVLYLAFRSQVHAQWALDLQEGERAVAQADWPALHRLAHSLKGVLSLLGDEPGAALARRLEAAGAAADARACALGWPLLSRHLALGGQAEAREKSD